MLYKSNSENDKNKKVMGEFYLYNTTISVTVSFYCCIYKQLHGHSGIQHYYEMEGGVKISIKILQGWCY